MNELQQSLNDHVQEQSKIVETDDGFTIDNDEKANWALRKIAEHEQHIQDANDLAQKEVDKIESWFKGIKESRQNQIDSLQSMLANYAMSKRQDDPDFKSMKLPSGRFGFRKRPDKWVYDDDKLLESLKRSGMDGLIRVKEEPNKRDLRSVVKVVNGKVFNPETGEFIEGITIEEQGESFNVAVEK